MHERTRPRRRSYNRLVSYERLREAAEASTCGAAAERAKRLLHDLPRADLVESVSSNEAEPVYDLQVSGQHEFIANGFVVHNCFINRAQKEAFLKAVWPGVFEEADKYIDGLDLARRLKIKLPPGELPVEEARIQKALDALGMTVEEAQRLGKKKKR
jgi:hypothetical protein